MRILTYLIIIMLTFLLVARKKEHTFYGHLYDAPAYDFELTSQDGKRVKLSDYTATIYLITPDRKIKLLFTPAKQDPKKMAEDIQYLLKSF